MFCQYCERSYLLGAVSDKELQKKRKRFFSIAAVLFIIFVALFKNFEGFFVYFLLQYLLKPKKLLKPVFIKSNNKHVAKKIRKFEPIGVISL